MRPRLINDNFTRLWLGQTVSGVGDYAFDTTLLLWIATSLMRGEPDAPLVSSAVLVVVAVTSALSAPLAGVLVDRWDKRRVMLNTDLLRFVLVGALTGLAAIQSDWIALTPKLIIVGLAVALATICTEFFNPARVVILGDLVPEEKHGTAAGYLQSSMSGAAIVGPTVAATLVVGVGVSWALLLNAVSFLFSYAMIWSIRTSPAQVGAPQSRSTDSENDEGRAASGGIFAEFKEGLQQFSSNTAIRALLVTSTLMMLGAGAINALDVYFVQENLHASPEWFGYISATFGVGALVGSLVAGKLGDRLGHARVFSAGMLFAAALFLVYSRMSNVWPALVLVLLFSLGLGALNTVAMPLILKVVPRSHLGRVISIFGPAAQIASVVSIGTAGAVVGALPLGYHVEVLGVGFGRIDAVFFVSAVIMLAGAVYATFVLRGVDRSKPADESEPRTDGDSETVADAPVPAGVRGEQATDTDRVADQ